MSLKVLIACPDDGKYFMDLMASCHLAKRHHSDLAVDVIVQPKAVPGWWTHTNPWLRILNQVSQADASYDLVIQLHPEPTLAQELKAIQTEHRSGIVIDNEIMVNGRWAQVFLAQLGARRFAPFSPHDLFNHILLGRTIAHVPPSSASATGEWIVDLDSLPATQRAWGEELLSQLNFAHPQHTRMEIPFPLNPKAISAYVGTNSSIATWLAFHGVPVVLLFSEEFDPRHLLAGPNASYVSFESRPTQGQIVALLKSDERATTQALRYTDEYLGGLSPVYPGSRLESSAQLFDYLHYIVFNYLNDLREVDLPIPEVSAACCLHLKGAQAVLGKLVHLNQFCMKYLQEFLAKVEIGDAMDRHVQEISQKVQEIDDLTDRTLMAYPEFDVYRLSLRFAKASAQGNNIVEIAKSLILVFHESNQTLQVYSELLETVIKRHARPQQAQGV